MIYNVSIRWKYRLSGMSVLLLLAIFLVGTMLMQPSLKLQNYHHPKRTIVSPQDNFSDEGQTRMIYQQEEEVSVVLTSSAIVHSSLLPQEDEQMDKNTKNGTFPITTRVTLPVFVASLFKSGTTSMHSFFRCGRYNAAHNPPKPKACLRNIIMKNETTDRDPFTECAPLGRFKKAPIEVWSDASSLNEKFCFEPSIHGALDALHHFHPKATVVLSVRDTLSWVSSVKRFRFKNWNLEDQLKNDCRGPGYFHRWIGRNVTDSDLADFYDYQVRFVRDFMRDHPSMTYIEISLDGKEKDSFSRTGILLEQATGISRDCWGHKNQNTRIAEQIID